MEKAQESKRNFLNNDMQNAIVGGMIGFAMSNYLPIIIKYFITLLRGLEKKAQDFSPEFDAYVTLASACVILIVVLCFYRPRSWLIVISV